MPRGSIEIKTYAAPEHLPRISSKIVTAFIGASLSLAIHLLMFTGALWAEGSSASRPPNRLADAASDTPDQDESAMQWISLDANTPADNPQEQVDLPAPDFGAMQLSADALVALAAVPQIAINNPDEQTARNSEDESNNRSALYGRYVGQIDARIFRAWLRPRTPIGAPSFTCRARINQDARGNVKDVELDGCNGDSRWQLSVVHAIQSSSPLPAPPDPRVFRHSVTVSFQSVGYREGAATDGFETPAAQSSDTAFPRRNDAEVAVTPTSDGIAIRIVGHPIAQDSQSIQTDPMPPEPGTLETSVDR